MKHNFYKYLLAALLISGCASISDPNKEYENKLIDHVCSMDSFLEAKSSVAQNDNTIFIGLNAGLRARDCKDYALSNSFFEAAQNAYQTDVDYEGEGEKLAKAALGTLVNENIFDYQGSLYERIMVNVYMGLNYMSLQDNANARVEFNRALFRQERAKYYFAKEIRQNLSKEDEVRNDADFASNVTQNVDDIRSQYSQLFAQFNASKNFTNPYATFLASVFFFMQKDYIHAQNLMREVSLTYPNNLALSKLNKVFIQAASKTQFNNHYVFFVYENGLSAIKKQFKLSVPFVVRNSGQYHVISTAIALPTLVKRPQSFEYLQINGTNTTNLVDFDDIIATEFRIKLPSIITQAVVSTLLKTTLNATVAAHDRTGGWLALAASVVTDLATQADVRSWRGLPKIAAFSMIKNNGLANISTPSGKILAKIKLNPSQNALIIVRSFMPSVSAQVFVMQE